jgi:molybdate transport system substrate-binding protein
MRAFGKPWLLALVLLVLAACGRPPEENSPGSGKVVVFVAASTQDAVRDIAAAFTKEQGARVVLNGDDSSKLATQITRDAPAHLFLSANEKWADFVRDKGYAKEVRLLLGNELVVVVPKGNPAAVKRPEDLRNAGVRRVAVAGPTVPAGMYARQALKKLNLWDELERGRKIVSGENVRVTLAYVERGEVEAGIVYATDARITDKVEQVCVFDASQHDPIRYPLVLLKEGQKSPNARAFFEFLQSPTAAAVFKKHGFTVLSGK